MFNEKLAVIIPTKDRPEELRRCLESIEDQGFKPAQIIIVDGGSRAVSGVVDSFSGLNIDYVRKTPPSLTAQRNAGIKMVRDGVSLVAFLDDDVALETDSLKNMMKFWEAASLDTAGACFNNMSEPFRRPAFLEKVFLVNADIPGRILPSGFQSIPCAVDRTMRIDWLIGCAMVFRRKVFEEFMFDEKFSGYARYEDVDFSYSVGKKYKMFVVADAKIKHFVKLENVGYSSALGKMEVVNRVYFVKKNPDLSVPLCYWALFGIFLNNIIKGLLGFDSRYKLRARGNLAGFLESLK
ncbi:MAG: glycosyltransferase [Candidatus Omnitrophica bacterium]|nr:glycosyltransferase [Candidatus Omnitrophota bacterium]